MRLPLIFSGFCQYCILDYFDFYAMRADNMADNRSGRLRPSPSAAAAKGISVVFHITLHHPAALDDRVPERIVHGRSLASDVAGILQVHLYPPHHLRAVVVRKLHPVREADTNVTDAEYPFRRTVNDQGDEPAR